jgi:glucokinase
LDLISGFSSNMEHAPDYVVVAAAGPVVDNQVVLTNARQSLCGRALRDVTGAKQAEIINDFAAAAWATHAPSPSDFTVLQGASVPPVGTRLVIGPGTGLGVGALAKAGDDYIAVPGEGGHIGIGPRAAAEVEVFVALRSLWPEVFFGDSLIIEAEGLLSGTGLPWFYQAVAQCHGQTVKTAPDAAEIMAAAHSGGDSIAQQVVALFQDHLAQAAGDLALAFGATGGVFLVGGVAMKNAWLFEERFLQRFIEGGRFTDKRTALNLYLLNLEYFGLAGAHSYAKQLAVREAK